VLIPDAAKVFGIKSVIICDLLGHYGTTLL
jgi:hypothetical protein